jgi:serine/threonine-protein kinase
VIPARVGFYEVLHKIGEGGMGAVFVARDRRSEQRIALKVLSPAYARDLQRRARFLREGELGRLVRHANVVAVHELGEAHLRGPERTLYLAMEMVPGRDLGHRLAFDTFDQNALVDIGRQIADGLDAAHREGVIHRDLKPGNVLVGSDGTAKLVDFGLAARLDERGLEDEMGVPLTTANAFVGTLGYAAPEQVAGQRADQRSDLFSLGVLLYQATTGRLPFPAQSRGEAIATFWRGLVPPSALAPGIAPGLEKLIVRLLAPRAADRVPSAAEAATLLRAVAETEGDALARPLAGEAVAPPGDTQKREGRMARLLRRLRRPGGTE